MQRLIQFGDTAEVSPEFGVDERAVVRLWLVRDDNTSTPGAYAYADVEIKASQGAQWTLFATLTGDRPWLDIVGVDDETRYRVVRPEAYPYIAVDRSSDSGASTTLRTPPTTEQLDFNDPDQRPMRIKGMAKASGTFTGVNYDYDPAALGTFGEFSSVPTLSAPDSSIEVYADSATNTFVFTLDNQAQDVDWTEYAGGTGAISTECFGDESTVVSYIFSIAPGDVSATGITVTLSTLPGDPGEGFEQVLTDNATFFLALARPTDSFQPIDLGPKTGRFTLARGQTPARLAAGAFLGDENIKLSLVEGSVVIPWMQNGTQVQLDADDNSIELVAPGEYEWKRSCNTTAGLYLNTGWK